MKVFFLSLIMLAIGVASGINYRSLASIAGFPLQATEMQDVEMEPDPDEPVYWVAPMDPNYRRDKPGKSPMGMDLVPVYSESEGGDDEIGTVTISPHVENNIGVRSEAATKGKLATRIDTVGYIQLDETAVTMVHPRVEGWLEKLYVKIEGQRVKKGEPLFSIYAPQLVAAQEEFLLALKRNEKVLIESARSRLRALQVSPGQIDALVKKQKVRQSVTVYAPRSGYITSLDIREGNFVKPGNLIMTIASLDQVWLMAEVFERQAVHLEKGAIGVMKLDYAPEEKWRGVVDYIYPVLDETTRTVKVRMIFDNPDMQLKPNMFAQVSISGKPMDDVILVPKEAVIRNAESDRVVLVMGKGKYKSINVGTGRMDKQYIEITEGIEVGEKVVTSAQFLLDSESSITSDFKRMEPMQSSVGRVWADGVINSVMPGHSMLNIQHEPIPDWGWGEMTMDFNVMEGVTLDGLTAGQNIRFEIEKNMDGTYTIASIGNESQINSHQHIHSKEEMQQ